MLVGCTSAVFTGSCSHIKPVLESVLCWPQYMALLLLQLSMDHVQVFPDGELNVQAAASRDTSPSFARPSSRTAQQRAMHMQEAVKLQSPSR